MKLEALRGEKRETLEVVGREGYKPNLEELVGLVRVGAKTREGHVPLGELERNSIIQYPTTKWESASSLRCWLLLSHQRPDVNAEETILSNS